MSDAPGQRESTGRTLRWFCGVPVLTNPLLLMDLASALVILWFVTVLVMALAQVVFGGGALAGTHLTAASIYASYLVLLVGILFVVVCLLFYRRGYVMCYRFEDNGVFVETLRARSVPGASGLHARPFAVGVPENVVGSVASDVDWSDVRSLRELTGMNSFQLRGKYGRLAQIYCPDEKTYREALAFARGKVERHA